MAEELTHFNAEGRAKMVDVTAKEATHRVAVAEGTVRMNPKTLTRIHEGKVAKGDVLAVAQVAGIMGAKRTPEIIPMCHPLLLTSVNLDFKEDPKLDRKGQVAINIKATVKTQGQTGVEMEALTAVTTAALTIYDMCKAIDRGISFTDIKLTKKAGGKSGTFVR